MPPAPNSLFYVRFSIPIINQFFCHFKQFRSRRFIFSLYVCYFVSDFFWHAVNLFHSSPVLSKIFGLNPTSGTNCYVHTPLGICSWSWGLVKDLRRTGLAGIEIPTMFRGFSPFRSRPVVAPSGRQSFASP